MSRDSLKRAMDKREAKVRAKILRQMEIIEKLLAMVPAKHSLDPSYRMTRDIMKAIRETMAWNPPGCRDAFITPKETTDVLP